MFIRQLFISLRVVYYGWTYNSAFLLLRMDSDLVTL